ncbi:hypothetical protein C478_07342 [Natrinema thermotolerans DSM 11552]|nr:hypothetical protein C478_07342 [Natrinema thermotolerans DSM 11552]
MTGDTNDRRTGDPTNIEDIPEHERDVLLTPREYILAKLKIARMEGELGGFPAEESSTADAGESTNDTPVLPAEDDTGERYFVSDSGVSLDDWR